MRPRQLFLIIAMGFPIATSLVAQSLQVDVTAVKGLVNRWNDCHTRQSAGELSQLYAGNVRFYGATLSRARCVSLKKAEITNVNNFKQTIEDDLVLSAYANDVVRCNFGKTVSRDGIAVDYQAYLIIKRICEIYLIVEESDLMTDHIFKNEPNLGTQVSIDDVRFPDDESNDGSRQGSKIVFAAGLLILGLVAGLVVFRRKRNPRTVSRTGNVTARPMTHLLEKGLAFEKFIVSRFGLDRNKFTLLDWRSDKFHEGIYARSIRDPDLVYEFKDRGSTRRFSVECKFRSKPGKGLVSLMNENKYNVYEAYHRNVMPVYIALGLGGAPGNPSELFLIPFEKVKLEMSFLELNPFLKKGRFLYDLERDRLI